MTEIGHFRREVQRGEGRHCRKRNVMVKKERKEKLEPKEKTEEVKRKQKKSERKRGIR